MALVNCPECGKSNVSDTAVSCPECGFAIKEYFDKVKGEEQRISNEKTMKIIKEKEEQRKKDTAEKRQKETISQLETQIEKSSKEIRNSAIGLIITLPLTIMCWCLSSHGSLGVFIILFGIASFASIIFLISGIQEKNTAISDLEIAKRNIEDYEKNLDKRLKAIAARGQAQAAQNAAKHPTCPICGSHNTERISTLNRTVSIATIGLASSKIGKQYQCKNCKHKW